jgi:D-alanine-D-alanine ligase
MVLFGGRSAEHEISCISARSVIDALDPDRHEVIPVGITREGRWQVLPGPPALPSETGALPEVTDASGGAADLVEGLGRSRELVAADGSRREIDVVFPVLHGPYGEDGATQGLLELAGVPFVGAGVLGSAVGMDKAVQKALFAAAGLRSATPSSRSRRRSARRSGSRRSPPPRGSPPGSTRRSGTRGRPSSSAASRTRARSSARSSATTTRSRRPRVLRLRGEVPRRSGRGAADPRRPRPGLLERIQRTSVAAFRAAECAGMARVDFFVRGDELWLNEINTIPGFTSISMYPKLWEASGLPYPELVERLLDLALERHEAERAKATDRG